MGKRREQVAIFGGAFDPPHNGHVAICTSLLDRGDVDRVRVVPCFRHPFGKPLSDFDDRYRMCCLAFDRLGRRIVVDDIERRMGGVSHTVRTLLQLIEEHLEELKKNP